MREKVLSELASLGNQDDTTERGIVSGWCGMASLRYVRHGDRTVPQVKTQAPIKVQRPFYPAGDGSCQSVLLHTAGGMVGGDLLHYNIYLEAQTHALITTAAAAKIYGYGEARHPAQVQGRMCLEPGAWLEWLPQEAIIFEGAEYAQSWEIDLAVGAHWLSWDILRLGRSARGERFCRGTVRSRTTVRQGDTLIWVDAQQLHGSEVLWHSPHALNACPVLGTLVWVGAYPDATVVSAARSAWDALANPTGMAGVTRLTQGLLCRYRGQSTTEARHWFTQVWQCLRPLYAGRAAILPRVWPL